MTTESELALVGSIQEIVSIDNRVFTARRDNATVSTNALGSSASFTFVKYTANINKISFTKFESDDFENKDPPISTQ